MSMGKHTYYSLIQTRRLGLQSQKILVAGMQHRKFPKQQHQLTPKELKAKQIEERIAVQKEAEAIDNVVVTELVLDVPVKGDIVNRNIKKGGRNKRG